ncbi:MAG: hypothetical protein ACK5GN_03825 [Pseudomonadota bacterium]|jgi:hypothetical protein
MFIKNSTPKWSDTTWATISQSTKIDLSVFEHYLGKARDLDSGSIRLGQINKNGAFVLNCGGGRWEAKYVVHPFDKLSIDNIQAFGLGVHIFSRIIQFGLRTRLFNRVELSAGKSGPHIWPRYGFLPSQDEWDSLRTAEHRLAVNLKEIANSPSEPDQVAAVCSSIESLLHDSDPRKIWELASQDDYIKLRSGVSGKVGTLILRGDQARYNAYFELNNEEQIDRFEAYRKIKLGY